MAPPSTTQELQTFLGLATYLGPFIPSLSSLTAPLRELVKKGNTFEWTPSRQAAFETIKSKISEKTTLAYYDPAKKIVLQVDASMKGLGQRFSRKANLLLLPAKR